MALNADRTCRGPKPLAGDQHVDEVRNQRGRARGTELVVADLRRGFEPAQVRHAGLLHIARVTVIILISVIASRVRRPPSRPTPLRVPEPPPNGRRVDQQVPESLMLTMPAGMASAKRKARSMSRVNTPTERPYSLSSASDIASSSSRKDRMGVTGPNVSSRLMRISRVTPVSTVGSKNSSLPRPGRGLPPHTTFAPDATASSTCSRTLAATLTLLSGPIVTP